jgi:hypothetical protein
MTTYNVVNLSGIAEITGNIGTLSAPATVDCTAYNVKQINLYSSVGSSTITFSFLTGTLILPAGESYSLELPLPISGCSIELTALGVGASLLYAIVGVK